MLLQLNLTSTIASGPVAPGGQYTAQFCCTGCVYALGCSHLSYHGNSFLLAFFSCSYATSSRYVYQAIVPSGYQASSIYLRYLSTEQGYDYCIVRSTAFIPAGYVSALFSTTFSARATTLSIPLPP